MKTSLREGNSSHKKTSSLEVFKKLENLIDKISETVFPTTNLTFAVAGIPQKIDIDTNMYFDVGSLPKRRTPARNLVEWKSDIRVKLPEEDTPDAPYVDMDYAQKEVSRMLEDGDACHEYIVYEAAKLVNDAEVDKYTMNLMLGAEAEDYIFMPNEELDDLMVRGKRRSYKTLWDYSKYILGKEPELTPTQWLFEKIAYLWRKITGSIEDDAVNRPYMAHFYEPKNRHGLIVANGEIEFQCARERIYKYWNLATKLYKRGEIGKAYYALGHLLHLIADMHVPAHVHNDIHGPTIILGKPDSLEEWVKKKDWKSIHRPKDKKNITIWDATDVPPAIIERINRMQKGNPANIDMWDESNIDRQLRYFVYLVAQYTYNFRSVDAEGRWDDQRRTGKLEDFECYYQADRLIPRAIGYSALMIMHFREWVKNNG